MRRRLSSGTLLKLDEPAVLAAAQGGELPGRRIGGHWRFSRGGHTNERGMPSPTLMIELLREFLREIAPVPSTGA